MPIRRQLGPRPALGVSLLIVSAVLAACGSAPGPNAVRATRIANISPVTAAGAAAPGYAAARTVTNGSCEPGSEAIGQAYRCFAGNGIYDPCWAERAATPEVLCLPAPWTRAEVRIRLLAPLPALLPVATDLGEPWGVQLASGQRCLLAQGAHDVFRGRIIDFLCRPGLALLRGLDEKSRLWTAQSVNGSSTAAMSLGPREQIVIAWYGRPDRPG